MRTVCHVVGALGMCLVGIGAFGCLAAENTIGLGVCVLLFAQFAAVAGIGSIISELQGLQKGKPARPPSSLRDDDPILDADEETWILERLDG